MGKTSSSKLVSFFGITFFILPMLALIAVIPNFIVEVYKIDVGEVMWALKNTLAQSLASYCFLVIGSFIGGLGLLKLHPHTRLSWVRPLIALPYFIPPIFAVLAAFQLFPGMPRGWMGISILHAWINVGMGSLITEIYLRRNFSSDRDVVLAFGIGKLNYIFKVVLPQTGALIGILLMGFFPLFFASFTIPLILGGSSGTTIEILIYEKLRLSQDWSIPVVLSLLQIFILAGLMWSLGLKTSNKTQEDSYPQSESMLWLGLRGGLAFLSVISFLFIGSFILSFATNSPVNLFTTVHNLPEVIYHSLFLIVILSILFFAGFSLVIYFDSKNLIKFLSIFNSPGSALVAFSFIILTLYFSGMGMVALGWAFIILFFPIIFRAFVMGTHQDLRGQVIAAQIYGANRLLIFKEIIYPQIRKSLVLGSAVAGLWVLGDFSVARILLPSDKYLGLVAGSLLGSYRLEQAGWVCLIILLLGLGNFILLTIMSRLYRGKFEVNK